jgi:hypothetical protein
LSIDNLPPSTAFITAAGCLTRHGFTVSARQRLRPGPAVVIAGQCRRHPPDQGGRFRGAAAEAADGRRQLLAPAFRAGCLVLSGAVLAYAFSTSQNAGESGSWGLY